MPAEKPQPVKIVETASPIPVTITEDKKEPILVNKEDKKTLAPLTTEQEDITTAGQRKVNLIWEFTQSSIAVIITMATIYTEIKQLESQAMSNAFFLIVSMYFVRTNHKLIGGVGRKPEVQNQQR